MCQLLDHYFLSATKLEAKKHKKENLIFFIKLINIFYIKKIVQLLKKLNMFDDV